jgi:glutamyl-tRNA reductase
MLLETPHRFELLAVLARDPAVERLIGRVVPFGGRASGPAYVKRGPAAVAHVARLCAGVRALSPDAPRMAARIRQAVQSGVRRGWTGVMIREWVEAALRLAPRLGPAGARKSTTGAARPVTAEYEQAYATIVRGFQSRNPVE